VSQQFQPGDLINDRYQVERLLGSGGFAYTYLVRDRQANDAPRAVKQFLPALVRDDHRSKARELFDREIDTLQKLDHPQVPRFHDSFEWDEGFFLVQEFVDGKTYSELIEENLRLQKTFTEAEVKQWLQDLLPLLHDLHGRRIYHRDIKPANIIRPHDGSKPVLIDFGAVKWQMTTMLASGGAASSIIGTQGYAAPEQLLRGTADARTDLYSLGMTALVMLTGREPQDLVNGDGEVQWDALALPTSAEFATLLNRLVQMRPSDRYDSAKAVLGELQRQLTPLTALDETVPAVSPYNPPTVFDPPIAPDSGKSARDNAPSQLPQPERQRSSQPMLVTAAIAAALVGVGAGGWAAIPYSNLCKTFNNCAKEGEWKTQYQEGREFLRVAQATGSTETIKDLERMIANLDSGIRRLEQVPSLSQNYEAAQQELTNAKTLKQQYEAKLTTLRQAENAYIQADQDLSKARMALTSYQTPQDLEAAIASAKAALQTLQGIAPGQPAHDRAQQVAQREAQLPKELEQLLTAEQAAVTALDKAKALDSNIQRAETDAKQTSENQRLANYRKARSLIEEAIKLLQNDDFSKTRSWDSIQAALQSYNDRQRAIDKIIADLQPAPSSTLSTASSTSSTTSSRSGSRSRSGSSSTRASSSSGSSGSISRSNRSTTIRITRNPPIRIRTSRNSGSVDRSRSRPSQPRQQPKPKPSGLIVPPVELE
jgi:serine/threonine protein kinase